MNNRKNGQGTKPQEQQPLLPHVDVREDESGITLLADLPGVPREGLELHLDGDTLTIEGTITALASGEIEPIHAEVRSPRYRWAFTLSRELDTHYIQAQLKDGVLNLCIPRQESALPERIEVQVS